MIVEGNELRPKTAAGQLEQELAENSWLTLPGSSDVIFSTPADQRLAAAAALLGIDMNLISGQAGHAWSPIRSAESLDRLNVGLVVGLMVRLVIGLMRQLLRVEHRLELAHRNRF